MTDVTSLNELLRGFTAVETLSFECEPGGDNLCRLRLALRRGNLEQGSVLRIVFHDVSGLALSGFGGGLTQVLCLRVSDIRERQLDRLNFEVAELERETLSFRCRGFEVS